MANLLCRALQSILPPQLRDWGLAIRHETAEIPDDTQALLFALASVRGLAPRALGMLLMQPFGALHSPRAVGALCAAGAVAMGLVYMTLAGAPVSYLGINAGALVLGLILLALVSRIPEAGERMSGALIFGLSVLLLATAFAGLRVEGAARWARLGGVSVQPSLVLLPLMLAGFSRTRTPLAAMGMVVAALALALQPDRAMAAMMTAALATVAATRADRPASLAFTASLVAFGVTLLRPDSLPAAPFVDQVLISSFQVHALAGLAVVAGSAMLLVPVLIGASGDEDSRATSLAFGAAWLTATLAAAFGHHPTPVVGYGGSAILGYVLSLATLPRPVKSRAGLVTAPPDAPLDSHDLHSRIALARP
ncbi:FtsW/RodA/SpoVE family cell cycle protein [Corallococcus sp. M7]